MFDLQEYLQSLQKNTDEIVLIAKNNAGAITSSAATDGWNALQIMEHIYLVDRAVMAGMLQPNLPIHESENIYGQKKLNTIIVNLRNRKVAAPDGMMPINQFESMLHFINNFQKQREKLYQYFLQQKIVIDNRKYVHPYLGDMTICDWCYFIISHSQRHLLQIEDGNANQ